MQNMTTHSTTLVARSTSLQITYTTDVLQSIFDLIETSKNLPNFRDLNF